jgi:tetratricopeptide (TPR) repeat protein
MMCPSRLLVVALLLLALVSSAAAQRGKSAKDANKKPAAQKNEIQLSGSVLLAAPGSHPLTSLLTSFAAHLARTSDKMPLTGLAAAKSMPNLCLLRYRISTDSPECQAFFDQGLGFFYSYAWMESARAFETAAKHDPNCAMAWWGLSRALERWGKNNHNQALKKAQDLLPRTSHRENLLITARLQEKGMAAGAGDAEARKRAAIGTLDTLLALYDDDEEGWYARAQLAGGAGLFGGQLSAVPYYKALLKLNPVHPGANHELVHFYENFKRPALGWPYALKYIESSPGIPHAFHMQAHLGMRIGKWDKTTDFSSRAIELQKTIHQVQGVKPAEDWQFGHHLETLFQSLTHDGRFDEARKLKKECEGHNFQHRMPWFRFHLAERNFDEALKIADLHRKSDKQTASYLAALVYLKKGDIDRAEPEVNVLQEAYRGKRNSRDLELRMWEAQGILLCRRGEADGGLKLLAKTVEKTKDDYRAHAWGHGAYFMECWGIEALHAGRLDVAEEAFLEALAHDAGSVRGALGMQVLCERQGRSEEASRFAELAQRVWRRADPGALANESLAMRGEKAVPVTTGSAAPKR